MTRVYVAAVLVAVVAGGCSTGTPLFNGKDLTGWVEIDSDGSWTVSDGVLRCSGEKKEGSYSWLSTDRKYADFELTMDWRIEPGTNAGVFLRAPSRKGRISKEGFEVQIKDDGNDADFTDVSGSVFKRIPAAGKFARPVGEWNHYAINCNGRRLRIKLNGNLVSDTDIDALQPPDKAWSMKAIANEGYIGLQNHGDPVEFRNIRIRELR